MKRQMGIPRPSLARLPIYFRRLQRALDEDEGVISSKELGLAASVPAAQVRKDLSHIGDLARADEAERAQDLGKAGVGYDTKALASTLERFLGLANDKEAVVVGAGNLGKALAAYPGFERYGLRIVALFDSDPVKIGTAIADKQVLPVNKLVDLTKRLQIKMGIITVPADAAQEAADLLVKAGVEVIWNFAPRRLAVPSHVLLESEDLAARLATLSYHITRQRVSEHHPKETQSAGAGIDKR